MVLHTLEICSGYAGFSLGLKLAGVEHRTVAHIERDSPAAAVLVARMEDQALDQAPIWSDLVTFDGGPWRGRVDLITAGFPCQPWSAAGQKRGLDDDRWLWPHIARIIAEVGPSLVFLENVPGLNRGPDGGGFSFVLQDLADFGFDAEWGLLAASDVGATHKRQRLWVLAHSASEGRLRRNADGGLPAFEPPQVGSAVGDAGSPGRQQERRGAPGDEGADGRWTQSGDVAGGADEDVGDAQSPGLQELGLAGQSQLTGPAAPGDTDVADAGGEHGVPRNGSGSDQSSSRLTDVQVGGTGLGWPPGRDDTDGWLEWIGRGGPQPSLRRNADGATGRLVKPDGLADRLHLLGNGLVPLAAAHAFLALSERLFSDRSC